MTIIETRLPLKARIFDRFAQRAGEWRYEFPCVIRGLWEATEQHRWQIAIVAIFNLLIVALETAQPWVLAVGVESLLKSAPYSKILYAIVVPALILQLPFTLLVPTLREVFTVLFFRPRLEKHLSILCLPDKPSSPDGGPAAQMGRGVVLPLIDSLLRDPLYVCRGLFLVASLFFLSPLLGTCLALGMVLDLFITLWIDVWLKPGFTRQQDLQFRITTMENEIHAGVRSKQAALRRFVRAWDARNCLFAWTQAKSLLAQNILREGSANIVRIALTALVGWWVYKGYADVKEYVILASLLTRVNDPVNAFLNLQNSLMQNAAALGRIEKMSGIPFIRRVRS